MENNLKLLSIEEKKVVAKVFYEAGWGSIKLEQLLGISDNTILRALKEATPENLKRFEEEFRKSLNKVRNYGLLLVYDRLIELIPKERRIDQIVKAGEYLGGKSEGSVVQKKEVGAYRSIDELSGEELDKIINRVSISEQNQPNEGKLNTFWVGGEN